MIIMGERVITLLPDPPLKVVFTCQPCRGIFGIRVDYDQLRKGCRWLDFAAGPKLPIPGNVHLNQLLEFSRATKIKC